MTLSWSPSSSQSGGSNAASGAMNNWLDDVADAADDEPVARDDSSVFVPVGVGDEDSDLLNKIRQLHSHQHDQESLALMVNG